MTTIATMQEFKNQHAVFANNTQQEAKITAALQAAERSLQSVLCNALFAKVKEDYDPDPAPAEVTALLPYAKLYVMAVAYRKYIPTADMHSTATGYRTFSDENSEKVSDKRLQLIVDDADSDITWSLTALRNFLESNITDYPEYEESACRSATGRAGSYRSSISGAGQKKYTDESYD